MKVRRFVEEESRSLHIFCVEQMRTDTLYTPVKQSTSLER